MRLKTIIFLMPDGVKIIPRVDDFSVLCGEDVKTVILSGAWDGVILDWTDGNQNVRYDFSEVFRVNGRVFSGAFCERAPVFAFALSHNKPDVPLKINFHQGVCEFSRQKFKYEKFGEGIYSTPFLISLLT